MKMFRNYGFFQSFILPALLVFLIPAFSLWFYQHAQHTFDVRLIDAIVHNIRREQGLSRAQQDLLISHVETSPLSRMLVSSTREAQEFTAHIPQDLKFDYQVFRIMAHVSLYCILFGIAMIVLMGISVHFASKTPQLQYVSLVVGWQLMRIFISLQAIAQCALAVSLSYWITALWFRVYDTRIIIVVVAVALFAVYAILAAIFKQVKFPLNLEGKLIGPETAHAFWNDLEQLCTQVGTARPDQVIGGIDDNFFVTENAINVDGERYLGRTLFISLSLLRIMPDDEVKAVLAHELAHFSGDDTYYTNTINPILNSYGHYLEALHKGFISLPVFYFALLFRVLYEANLRRLGREREFRADRIAAECTSPLASAGALLRIMAFSQYHYQTEMEIYNSKETEANLVQRLKDGFLSFAAKFANENHWGDEITAHPFDTHPATNHRLQALGIDLTPEFVSGVLAKPADEAWYRKIDHAEVIENRLWMAYQHQFRASHEVSLSYRYLGESDEERDHIELHFPPRTITLPKDTLVVIDYEKVSYTKWSRPVYWAEVLTVTAENDVGTYVIQFSLNSSNHEIRKFPLPKKQAEINRITQILGNYFGRYQSAVAYKASQTGER